MSGMMRVSVQELDWYRRAIGHLDELVVGARALPGQRWSANAAFLEMMMKQYQTVLEELEEIAASQAGQMSGE